MANTKSNDAKIHFRSGIEYAGFSSSATSNATNADATTVIRELIQNSLDAAKEKNREHAHIKFTIEKVKQESLPGFSDLHKSFLSAVSTQKKINGGGNYLMFRIR